MKSRGRGKVTVHDVASAAGVSIAAVTDVMNKPERVGGRTRRRLLLTCPLSDSRSRRPAHSPPGC